MPQDKRFIAATSWQRAGNSACCAALRDNDAAVLERLAQLSNAPRRFRQLVQEQNAVMRQGNLAGPRR